jgi:cytochrome c-type biogenesis protein CcmH
MRQGASDSEIVDFMVARYGDFVLYRPPFKATTLLLWLGPLLLLAAGAAVLLRRLRHRQPGDAFSLSATERVRAEKLLAGDEAERR